jgi:hypothetical protein
VQSCDPNRRPSMPALDFRRLGALRVCLRSTFGVMQVLQERVPFLANEGVEQQHGQFYDSHVLCVRHH